MFEETIPLELFTSSDDTLLEVSSGFVSSREASTVGMFSLEDDSGRGELNSPSS